MKTLDLEALTTPNMLQFAHVEFEDRSDVQVFRIIKALHPEARRVIAVGGSAELLMNLTSHTPIVYVDANKREMQRVFAKISETLPRALEQITFICDEVVESIGRAFSIQPGDVVLFLRSLHHLDDPSAVLAKIKSHLLDGWIVIADSSLELMTAWQTRSEAHTQDSAYIQNMSAMGIVDEISVRRFLAKNRLGLAYLFYNPPCPCGELFCSQQTFGWFSAHPVPQE